MPTPIFVLLMSLIASETSRAESWDASGVPCSIMYGCSAPEINAARACEGKLSASSFRTSFCCPNDPTCEILMPPQAGQTWSSSPECELALQMDQLKKVDSALTQTDPNDPRNAEVAEYKQWLEIQIARDEPGCAMLRLPELQVEEEALALAALKIPPPSPEESLKACTTLHHEPVRINPPIEKNQNPIYQAAVEATTTCRDSGRNTVSRPPYSMNGACPPKDKGQSIGRCAMYVSMAISKAGCGEARSLYAKDLGPALERIGFRKLWPSGKEAQFSFSNFPEGAVFVFDQAGRPGHVEIGGRDSQGKQYFVSDYASQYPVTRRDATTSPSSASNPFKLIGVYYKDPASCTGGS